MNDLPLRDIHLPEPLGWWPPAPGWWVLFLALIALTIGVYRLIKRLKRKPAKKLALTELQKIRSEYSRCQNKAGLIQALSVLLRRVGMSYTSREEVAGLTGAQWLNFLKSLSDDVRFPEQLAEVLLVAPYQRDSDFDAEAILDSVNEWLKALPEGRTHDPV